MERNGCCTHTIMWCLTFRCAPPLWDSGWLNRGKHEAQGSTGNFYAIRSPVTTSGERGELGVRWRPLGGRADGEQGSCSHTPREVMASWKARDISTRAWIQDLKDISGADWGQNHKHSLLSTAYIIIGLSVNQIFKINLHVHVLPECVSVSYIHVHGGRRGCGMLSDWSFR